MGEPLSPAALVAPGPRELAEATRALDDRLARAEAIGGAVARLHGALGEAFAAATPVDACADPAWGSVVARTRVFGAAYRDAAQDARAAADRLAYVHGSAMIAPLLDENDRAAFARAEAAVLRHVDAYLEMAAWQTRFVEPTARGCELALTPVDGLPWTGAVAVDDPRAVAFIALDGFVCPGGVAASGGVYVAEGAACLAADASCACEAVPVAPGAVLSSR